MFQSFCFGVLVSIFGFPTVAAEFQFRNFRLIPFVPELELQETHTPEAGGPSSSRERENLPRNTLETILRTSSRASARTQTGRRPGGTGAGKKLYRHSERIE